MRVRRVFLILMQFQHSSCFCYLPLPFPLNSFQQSYHDSSPCPFSHFIASELASFDWDTFQALLSLLLYLDAFLQLLHRSHHTVISFFSTNRELLLELASGGAIPKEMALSAMDFVLLEMQSKEESWQSSVLTVSRKEKSYSVDGIRDDD